MTEALFRGDPDLTHCVATLVRVEAGGLVLNQTVMYPQGGGQAGDAGEIVLPDGQILRIADTRKGDMADILHVPAQGQDDVMAALTQAMLQGPVSLMVRIDIARRQAHRRFHTATHLLCALVPHPVDGCSINASYARLDFHMAEPLDKTALTEGLARLIAEGHPVRDRWISDAELDANPGLVRSMSVQPPRGTGQVRLLDIEGVDLQPCGGTHVNNTADIGAVIVTKVEKKSAMTRRVVLGFLPSEGESKD